jgi:hypothetical protein
MGRNPRDEVLGAICPASAQHDARQRRLPKAAKSAYAERGIRQDALQRCCVAQRHCCANSSASLLKRELQTKSIGALNVWQSMIFSKDRFPPRIIFRIML